MLRTPTVSALIGQCQVCGTDGSIARMNSVWWNRKEVRYHTVCGICSHLFDRGSLKPHPFRQTHVSSLATDGWWASRTDWSPVGGADGRGRFLRPAETENLVEQLRAGVYLTPGVIEEQLAPRRALLDNGASAAFATTSLLGQLLDLGARQYEREVKRSQKEGHRRSRAVAKRGVAADYEIADGDLVEEPVRDPQPPTRPKCDGCGKTHKTVAYEVGGGLMCKSCARVWLGDGADFRSAEARLYRVWLVLDHASGSWKTFKSQQPKKRLRIGELVEKEAPSVVIEEAVEIATEPAPEPEAPEVIDPEQAAARGETHRLLENGLIRRRLTEAQLNNVKFLYGQGDFTRALKLLQRMISDSVKRPVVEPKPVPAECERPNCHRPPYTARGPFADVHGLGDRDSEIAKADGEYVCWPCRGELIARTKRRLLAERPTPPLERREPLAAKGGAGEREVKPAVVHATA